MERGEQKKGHEGPLEIFLVWWELLGTKSGI